MSRVEYWNDTEMCDFDGEYWKDIYGYEGIYQVSNKGRIKSFHQNKILKQWNNGGEKEAYITLCADGNKYKLSVLQIVGMVFIGNPNRKKNEQFCHLDSNRLNNCLENISIEKRSSRALLSYHNGVLKDWGIKHVGKATQFVSQYKFIGTNKKGEKHEYLYNDLLLKYGSGVRSIYRVLEGKKHFNTAYSQTWERVLIS